MKDTRNLVAGDSAGQVPRTAVVVAAEWLAAASPADRDGLAGLDLHPTPREAPADRRIAAEAQVLVLEVDADIGSTLDRVAEYKQLRPELSIVAAVRNADLSVMRVLLHHGIADVIQLPLNFAELTSKIYDLGAGIAARHDVALAPAICFAGALGRSGTTSLLLHLAEAIARLSEHPLRCGVLDLDFQSGLLASYSGIETPRTVLDLLDGGQRLDRDMLRNVATKVSEGVFVIPAPAEILPIEQVDFEQLQKIVRMAQVEFDVLLIDMPSAWTNWSLSLALNADRIVLVTGQTLPHLRQTRRYLDLFRDVGFDADAVDVVVNRASRSRFAKISISAVEDALNRSLVGAVVDDGGDLARAVDEGRLITQASRKSAYAKDVDALARHYLQFIGTPSQ